MAIYYLGCIREFQLHLQESGHWTTSFLCGGDRFALLVFSPVRMRFKDSGIMSRIVCRAIEVLIADEMSTKSAAFQAFWSFFRKTLARWMEACYSSPPVAQRSEQNDSAAATAGPVL